LIQDEGTRVEELKDRNSKKIVECRDEILTKEHELVATVTALKQQESLLRKLEEKFSVKYDEYKNILREKEGLLEIVSQVGNNFVESIETYHKTLEGKISEISITERDSCLSKFDMLQITPQK
jgi:regulator of RNase E activity RraB